jgi:hypothetical protein
VLPQVLTGVIYSIVDDVDGLISRHIKIALPIALPLLSIEQAKFSTISLDSRRRDAFAPIGRVINQHIRFPINENEARVGAW